MPRRKKYTSLPRQCRVEKSIHFSKKKKKSVPAETYFLLFLVALHPRLFSTHFSKSVPAETYFRVVALHTFFYAALTRKRSINNSHFFLLTNIMNSIFLFMLFCIPIRIILTLLPNYELIKKYIPIKNIKIFYQVLGIIFLCISIGFLYLYFTNSRLKAPEAGGLTWWHNLRLLHGLLYLCASIYILYNINDIQLIKYASIPLLFDVILGLLSFINYRLL